MTGLCHTWSSVDNLVSRRHTSAMDTPAKRKPTNLLPLGPGLAVPKEFTFLVEEEGLYSLEAEAVYEQPVGGRMGHFVIDRLTIRRREDGPPVTTEGIRQIPVAAFLRLAVEGHRMRVGPREYDGHTSSWELTWAGPIALSERARAGGGPSDEDLRAVADVYQLAYVTGGAPTKTVMERLGLPRSTASRWIALARKQGLLGPATPRKAGG
jgi:hypothetical protein